MKYLCTLSDKNFLAKGIALQLSLIEHSSEPFRMYYLAMDQEAFDTLSELEIKLSPNGHTLVPVSLKDLEENQEELRTARNNRPYNEYCWTLASYFSDYLLNHENIDHITYIDSDIYFYADIDIFYKELGQKSIGLVTHRHISRGHQDGAYNVGVVYFKKDKPGQDCLFWWKDAVLNKKYPEYFGCGDQKYLEGFEPLIGAQNICVADETYAHGAPWHYRLFGWDDYIRTGTIVWGGRVQPFVFNHFSRMTYDIATDFVKQTTDQYAVHTLNNQVFTIPAVNKLYMDYYLKLKSIHQTYLTPKAPAIKKPPLKISFGTIVFESDYVLKQCLEAVYPFAHQLLVAEGPVTYWQELGRTTSTDNTNKILDEFPDPDHKLKVVHGQFVEKDDQCNAYMSHLKADADYVWNLDSDEIFKPEDVEKIIRLLHDEKYTSVSIRSCTLFGGFDRYITGWEEERDQFMRIFKVYPGSQWAGHRPPRMAHCQQNILEEKHLDSDRLFLQHGVRMYHYSYVWPRQVANKTRYYKSALTREKCVDNYFENVYLPWVMGSAEERINIERQYEGVHEYRPQFRRPTFTAPFTAGHPPVIERDLAELKKAFDTQRIGQ